MQPTGIVETPVRNDHSAASSREQVYTPTPTARSNIRDRYRAWRKLVYEYLPYIKRRLHRKLIAKLQVKIDTTSDCLLSLPGFATAATITTLISPQKTTFNELCLFVSFAPEPELKLHALDHLNALLDEGIAVILIINSELPAAAFQIPPALMSRLSGCLVRQNLGFDFAAWAHAYHLIEPAQIQQRLYFVNDSMVGPLDRNAYRQLIARIRNTPGDMLGLTESLDQHPHLQSFFLVFTQRLFSSETFRHFMHSVLNLPTKQAVIDLYEAQLTRFLRSRGFSCTALFPKPAAHAVVSDDTIFNWANLIENGFPFIKASVLKHAHTSPDAVRLVPSQYRQINP